jgi:hypothetical protein
MGDIFKHPATYLALPIVVYFLGWSYLYTYFGFFEIELANLQLPLEHFFTIGFNALVRGIATEFPGDGFVTAQHVAIVSAVLLAAAILAPIQRLMRLRLYLGLLFAVIHVAAGWSVVIKMAQQDMLDLPKPVRVVMAAPSPGEEVAQTAAEANPLRAQIKQHSDEISDEFEQWNVAGFLRLIYQHPEYVVVGYADCESGAALAHTCEWMVWTIPKESIRMTRVWEEADGSVGQPQ